MSDRVQTSRIKQKTVVEQVMDRIRELIASGQFKKNNRIPTESELAETFGIGRSSIREAIKVFNYLGVLESRTAKGTFVCERSNISSEALTWSILLGRDDYCELIDMRGAMEMWSMLVLTRRCRDDPAQVRECLELLEDLIEKMRQAIERSDSRALTAADYDFHGALIGGSGTELFTAIYGVLRSFMYEEIEKHYRSYPDITSFIGEHRAYVDAIRSGDAHQALEVVHAHIAGIRARLMDPLRR